MIEEYWLTLPPHHINELALTLELGWFLICVEVLPVAVWVLSVDSTQSLKTQTTDHGKTFSILCPSQFDKVAW